VSAGSGVAGWVAEHRHPVCVSRLHDHGEVAGSGRSHYQSGTFLSVPLEGEDGPLGVLNVTDPSHGGSFHAEECHLLLQLAERVGAAWQSARRADASPDGSGQRPLADVTLELRDALEQVGDGNGSAERINTARSLARTLGLTESEIGAISYAASLDAPTGDGQGPPRALESMSMSREVALSQHEWWDGTGYPRGLKAADIPVGGRILAVVDAFERMTVGRPHRPARTREAALDEIRRLRGRQFDPAVVDAFERLLPLLDGSRETPAPELGTAGIADTGR